MTTTSIRAPNSTLLELALEETFDLDGIIGPALETARAIMYQRPIVEGFQTALTFEYGLGIIDEFFETTEDLIDAGRPWLKIRGTPLAITWALGWIGYDDITIEHQVRGRRRWHLYQIGMGELPGPTEVERLTNAEYLAGVSDRARSLFWRGYFGYDVRGLVWGRKRWGRSIWGDSSGVRLPGGYTKWSFGRTWEISATAAVGDDILLGVDYEDGDPLSWPEGMTWSTPGISWAGVTDAAALKAWLMAQKSTHVAVYDGDDEVLGYAKVLRPIVDRTDGGTPAGKAEVEYEVSILPGKASGVVASVALVFGGSVISGKPFRPWLNPDEIEFPGGAIVVAKTELDFNLLLTVRESIFITLTI